MEADKSTDQITKLLYKTLDSLLFEGPKTTGYGTLLGLILYSLVQGFAPLIERTGIGRFFDVEKIPWLFYPAIGVLASNLMSWARRMIKKPMPSEIKTAFILIEEAKRNGSLTTDEVKARYLSVIDDYIGKLARPAEEPAAGRARRKLPKKTSRP
jgi:hypothetical protein